MTSRPRRPAARRAAGAVTVVALLVGAVVVNRVADELPTTPAASTSDSGSRQDEPAKQVPEDVRGEPPPAPLPQDGPGVSEAGILLVARPADGTTLDVAEWVLLAAPTRTIELSPPDLSEAGSGFTDAVPSASLLRVDVDDQPVPAPDGVTDVTTISLDEPTRAYVLRYQLDDAVVRSLPSTSGRALAAFTPLTSSVPDELPVAVATWGDDVRNLACPLAELPEEPCAAGTPPLLRVNVDLPRKGALVVMQFDLREDA